MPLTEGQPGVSHLQIDFNISGEAHVIVGQTGVSQRHVFIITVPDTWQREKPDEITDEKTVWLTGHICDDLKDSPKAPTAKTPMMRIHTRTGAVKRNNKRKKTLTTIAMTRPLKKHQQQIQNIKY